jgi:excisionase family DNA binding protein
MNNAIPTPNQEAIQLEQLSEVMTADEVARMLRVSRKTVYSSFKRGEIPGGRRLGSALRFSRKRVLQWLDEGQERGSRSPKGVR